MTVTVGEFLNREVSAFWFECAGGDRDWPEFVVNDADRNLSDTLLHRLGIDPDTPLATVDRWIVTGKEHTKQMNSLRQRFVDELSLAVHGEVIKGAPEDVWRVLLRTVRDELEELQEFLDT